ncbi:DUF2586 family protein [Pedobacter sp. MW01-1-1]|uniref:DUF2586 family protein n=1 Tax=Pedobacter sp. MW01-1-1 TaxID=3383027 RepID=UPI003FF0011C
MGRPNVTITKRNGALGRRNATTDGVCALVTTGVAVAGSGNLSLNTTYALKSQRDANRIGLNVNYDATNKVLVYHHIDRFFKRSPNGTLYLMVAAQTETLSDLVDVAQNYAKALLREQKGLVKAVGITINPDEQYEATLANGLDGDVFNAVANAQALYNSEFELFRYASFLIEGRSFNGTAAAAKDLRTLNAPNVSVTIAADPAISGIDPLYNGYAAVGDVLGLISSAAVSQNVGEQTPDFNLNDTGLKQFVTAGLSSGLDIYSYGDEDLDALDEKGYIFPTAVAGLDGFYLNDSHTCSELEDNDFAYIENNRTIEKAIFLARQAILPQVKSRLKVDPDTGYLQDDVLKALEAAGIKSIEPMQKDGDISGGIDCYIEPEQNLLSSSELNVELSFVPVAIGRQINISIGFLNPFKA